MVAHSRFFNIALGVLLASVVLYHGVVHWRVIWLVEPATARETAWVGNIKAYLDSTATRPYSLESIPGATNLYGIGYLWGAAPFVALLPLDGIVSLRIANAFFLGLLMFAIGGGFKQSNTQYRAFALVLIYALYISSPSVAAGPDILACVLYMLAWRAAVSFDFKPAALGLSIVLGFLALLTKPYLVLVIPAIGLYLLVFRSLKTGVLYTLTVMCFFTVGLGLLHRFYPYYFVSVFGVHAAAASRDLMVAVYQWTEFVGLAIVPVVVGGWSAVRWLRTNLSTMNFQFRWSAPLVQTRQLMNPFAWGAVVAFAALALSLSWHGGAHLIYFWHLLLPLLILSHFAGPTQKPHPGWLCINALVLLLFRPPVPATGASVAWQTLEKIAMSHDRIYVDPFLQTLRPETLGSPVHENAQSEFLIKRGLAGKDPALLKQVSSFVQEQQQRFRDREYDALLLTEGVFDRELWLPAIHSRYKITAVLKVDSYYLTFRQRWNFGRSPMPVLLFEPKDRP